MKQIKNAISGVIAGFLFIVIGIVLLWWNEGNDVKNIKTIEEARASLVNISSDKVDASNEGKLVSTSGEIKVIDESLTDNYFNVVVPGTGKLVRVVEMYQWVEDCDTEDDRTVCDYEKKWLSHVENSDFFEEAGHENPETMPFEDEAYYANDVELGAFKLSATQIQMLSTNATVSLDNSVFLPNGYVVSGNYITSVTNVNSPNVGDVRISFNYSNDRVITVLAMQKGNSFADYKSEQGKILNELRAGALTGEEMINVVESRNNFLKWILRFVGVLFVTAGFSGLLTPILMLLSIIPLVGDGIANILKTIASLIGFAVSMLVIALAWVAYRPLIGICLLAVVVGVIILVTILIKKGKNKAALQQGMQQPMNPGMPQQPMMQQQPVQAQMMQPQMMQQPMGQQQPVQAQMMQPQMVQQPIGQQVMQPQQPINPLEQQQILAAQQAQQEQQMAAQQAQLAAQQPQQSQDPLSIFGQGNQ